MRESCRALRGIGGGGLHGRKGGELAEKRQKFGFGESEAELVGTQVLLGRDDDVHAGHLMLMQAEEGAQNPLYAVSGNGIAAFFGHSKTKTPVSEVFGAAGEYDEILRVAAFSPVVAGGVFRPTGDASFSGPGQ